jgi:hypothetical protein
MAHALRQTESEEQLAFFSEAEQLPPRNDARTAARFTAPLCAGCRAKEARYGFRRDEDGPAMDRPRTLCFECFRVELSHRQAVAERIARGWNGAQVSLPLEATLNELTRRRGRAQIAARKALNLR